jgi:hypothetical protein
MSLNPFSRKEEGFIEEGGMWKEEGGLGSCENYSLT